MTSVPVESRPWSPRRWWCLVLLAFGVQIALVFWLGDKVPIRPRPANPGLSLRIAENESTELLTLCDPTLFALPRPQTLSMPGWLKFKHADARVFAWPKPAPSPALAVDQLAAHFSRLIQTNNLAPILPPPCPKPRSMLPEIADQPAWPSQSSMRLEGGLAQRRLLAPLDLRSWASRDILTNSTVQVLVDALGVPRSVVLLAGSGSPEADQHALNQAKAARFEPLSRNPADLAPTPTARLSWGNIVFLWRTLPLPPTNAPPAGP